MSFRLAFALFALGSPLLRAADDSAMADFSDYGQVRAKIDALFHRTREKVDALFRGRDAVQVVPPDVTNPFSRPEERSRAGGSGMGGSGFSLRPTISDRGLLERIAPAILVRGIVEAGGHPSIIINRKLFDEGDSLTILYGEVTMDIVIKRITEDTFTLGYKDAELTLSLPRAVAAGHGVQSAVKRGAGN